MSFLTPAGIVPLYQNLESFERVLNFAGYIPGLGTLSATFARKAFAVAEVAAGIALGILYLIPGAAPAALSAFYGVTAVTFLKHGILNGFRGTLELSPASALLICLPFDLIVGRYFPYPV